MCTCSIYINTQLTPNYTIWLTEECIMLIYFPKSVFGFWGTDFCITCLYSSESWHPVWKKGLKKKIIWWNTPIPNPPNCDTGYDNERTIL